ncbi:hypothetical protein N039_11220 [Staphylococcus sp. EGD-HP3]|nr:hypothetical protein N039_11220 [Staphylococcus sp. EGD-HP3]
MKIVFNIWVCLLLFLVIALWTMISIKFGNINSNQVILMNIFIFIAYILYIVRFIKYYE